MAFSNSPDRAISVKASTTLDGGGNKAVFIKPERETSSHVTRKIRTGMARRMGFMQLTVLDVERTGERRYVQGSWTAPGLTRLRGSACMFCRKSGAAVLAGTVPFSLAQAAS